VNILLVDDEPLARDRLERLLGGLRPQARCLHAADGEQALAAVAAGAIDLVLLDINMPGIGGLEVAEQLDAIDNPPAVIFCTAYDEYALRALQHQVVAYLLKPVREADLARALEAAGRVTRVQLASLQRELETPADARSHVHSQSPAGLQSLPLEVVRCFVAQEKYVIAYSPDAEMVIADTLKDLERELGEAFLRVHRNTLVAVQHVSALRRTDAGGWCLELDGLALRPQVSRRHLSEVKSRLRAR
jgi:two-component system response regulator AlgR